MLRSTNIEVEAKDLYNQLAGHFGYVNGFEFGEFARVPENNLHALVQHLKHMKAHAGKPGFILKQADFDNWGKQLNALEIFSTVLEFTATDASDISLTGTLTFSEPTEVVVDYGGGVTERKAAAFSIAFAKTLEDTTVHTVKLKFRKPLSLIGVVIAGKLTTISSLAALDNLVTLDLSGNTLSVSEVSTVLTELDANGKQNGTVNLNQTPDAVPNGAGDTAITSLQGKGWTVTVDTV